jgi:UDP-N-acetylmuramate--L-alanine ligase/UDP-N-acetylenolpyruvoylglucosamine reductase
MPSVDVAGVTALLGAGRRRCHLIGVGGSGMSGLAGLLLERGHAVSGSDLKRSAAVDPLERAGLVFHAGHAAGQEEGADLVVCSSAIPESNPERAAAVARDQAWCGRAQALAGLLAGRKLALVAGTHGKTTTSAMLAHGLSAAGEPVGYYIGAQVPVLGGCARWGGDGWFVAEGDESDGSIASFQPASMILLNVEAEHHDHFGNEENVRACFSAVCAKTAGRIIYVHDDPGARAVAGGRPDAVSVGFAEEADYVIRDFSARSDGVDFSLWHRGAQLVRVGLAVPGRHNASNAAAVLAWAHAHGFAVGEVARALAEFRGARRRFEVLFEDDRYVLVDDYAHHPTEIRATIEAARERARGRILVAFQPHRYSRTAALMEEFAECFDGADLVFLAGIYGAGEPPREGVTGETLAGVVRARRPVVYCPELADLKAQAGQALQPGDLLLVMGAGDVEGTAHEWARGLELYREIRSLAGPGGEVRPFEPMSRHTSMRVGGPADVWAEPQDEEALAAILRHCQGRGVPVTFIGRGTNLLVKDRGIRGVCIHLGRPAFSAIRVKDGLIEAGAGARLKQIVNEARKAGIGGLEFMEGIPATLGGALRMNAGAMQSWMFEVVESVRFMRPDGTVGTMAASEMEVHYRNVPLFRDNIALGAVLRGTGVPAAEIADRLKAYSRKRWESQPAAPSAGCIFKNPQEIPAGKLIDELGLKGMSVGAARVSPVHGNFIVNEGGARASDVLELIGQVQAKVRAARGIELDPEVIILGE